MADLAGTGAARRRRERRLRQFMRHERLSVAMALAEYSHHTSRGQRVARAGGVEREENFEPRLQDPPLPQGAASTVFYTFGDDEEVLAAGVRPPPLAEVRPQERLLWHCGVGYELVQALDVPVLHKVEEVDERNDRATLQLLQGLTAPPGSPAGKRRKRKKRRKKKLPKTSSSLPSPPKVRMKELDGVSLYSDRTHLYFQSSGELIHLRGDAGLLDERSASLRTAHPASPALAGHREMLDSLDVYDHHRYVRSSGAHGGLGFSGNLNGDLWWVRPDDLTQVLLEYGQRANVTIARMYGHLWWLPSDGKTQVTVEHVTDAYKNGDLWWMRPVGKTQVLISSLLVFREMMAWLDEGSSSILTVVGVRPQERERALNLYSERTHLYMELSGSSSLVDLREILAWLAYNIIIDTYVVGVRRWSLQVC